MPVPEREVAKPAGPGVRGAPLDPCLAVPEQPHQRPHRRTRFRRGAQETGVWHGVAQEEDKGRDPGVRRTRAESGDVSFVMDAFPRLRELGRRVNEWECNLAGHGSVCTGARRPGNDGDRQKKEWVASTVDRRVQESVAVVGIDFGLLPPPRPSSAASSTGTVHAACTSRVGAQWRTPHVTARDAGWRHRRCRSSGPL